MDKRQAECSLATKSLSLWIDHPGASRFAIVNCGAWRFAMVLGCLVGALSLSGCKAESQADAALVPDLSVPSDLSAADDLSEPPDQRAARDLITLADQRPTPDLLGDAGPPDLHCAANTQTDPANCGTCGHACAAGQGCCAGVCSDPQGDARNCGACGHDCGGSACCAGLCTSLNTLKNCGACGMQCTSGQSCCGGGCSNKDSDPLNCGYCGTACPAGYYCFHGACQNPDASPPPDMTTGCLNGAKSPPAVCAVEHDPMSGSGYTFCRADCSSAWIANADAGGGTFAFQTICQNLGYTKAAQWGGTCGDICGYCQGHVNSCMMTGTEKYDGGGVCGADCLGSTVMWECVK